MTGALIVPFTFIIETIHLHTLHRQTEKKRKKEGQGLQLGHDEQGKKKSSTEQAMIRKNVYNGDCHWDHAQQCNCWQNFFSVVISNHNHPMGFEMMMPLQLSVGQNRKIVTVLMTQTAGLVFPISSCPCQDPKGQCGGGNSIEHPSNTRHASPCPLCLSAYVTCLLI